MATVREALDAAAIPFEDVEVDGRPRDFNPIGVMVHHTGSENSSIDTIVNGRSDLTGPLYHVFVEEHPSALTYLVTEGLANHAGLGSADQLARIKEGKPPTITPNDPATIGGNEHFVGVSSEGDTPDDWFSEGQYTARYVRLVEVVAALCKANGWTHNAIIGHKEWRATKPDPLFSMATFREHVRLELIGSERPQPRPPSPWAEEAWQKAIDLGIIRDTADPHHRPKKQYVFWVLDRLGLLDP